MVFHGHIYNGFEPQLRTGNLAWEFPCPLLDESCCSFILGYGWVRPEHTLSKCVHALKSYFSTWGPRGDSFGSLKTWLRFPRLVSTVALVHEKTWPTRLSRGYGRHRYFDIVTNNDLISMKLTVSMFFSVYRGSAMGEIFVFGVAYPQLHLSSLLSDWLYDSLFSWVGAYLSNYWDRLECGLKFSNFIWLWSD